MGEQKKVEIGGVIIGNIYSGYYERVYYAGMPSPDSFSLVYETAYVRENPDSHSIFTHACDELIKNVQDRIQLFFPIDTKSVEFPSRSSCRFDVKEVSPKSLTAIIDE